MRSLIVLSVTVLAASASHAQQPRTNLEARFIGNMSYAITDGDLTLFTDFPYESGYSVYMTYDPREIRSTTPRSLALITHRHRDHWEPALFGSTDWSVVGPEDAVAGAAANRVVRALPVEPSRQTVAYEGISIEALPTPHANIGHYSYIVTWHGKRMYFSGDTEGPESLLNAKDLDVAFVSPWLFQAAQRSGRPINARRIVIYHQEAGQVTVAGCSGICSVPRQGDKLQIVD